MRSENTTGKIALVTGGSGGIGSEIARRLAADGFALMVGYGQSAEATGQVAQAIVQAGGEAATVRADVSQADQVQAAFDATIDRFGRVDVVVNNAGVIAPGGDRQPHRRWLRRGVRRQRARRAMAHAAGGAALAGRRQGHQYRVDHGRRADSRRCAVRGEQGRVLSKEVGARAITVNTLLKRLGTPQDAAEAVAFLAGEGARWLTGQVITVDGGAT